MVYAFDEFMIHSNSERMAKIFQVVYEADENGNDELEHRTSSRSAFCVLSSLINYWELISSGISHPPRLEFNGKFLFFIFPSFPCVII